MPNPECVQLPFLFPSPGGENMGAKYFWPGHGGMPEEAWQPDGLPLSTQEADQFIASLDVQSLKDLEAMRLLLNFSLNDNELKDWEEMANLALFAGKPVKKDIWTLALERAQRLLLWRWHLEKRLREISRLENQCRKIEHDLRSSLADMTEPASIKNRIDSAHAPDDGLPGPGSWKACAANAILFLEPDTHIMACGLMREEIKDAIEKRKGQSAYNPSNDGQYTMIRAPFWMIIGRERPYKSGMEKLNLTYNTERIWVV